MGAKHVALESFANIQSHIWQNKSRLHPLALVAAGQAQTLCRLIITQQRIHLSGRCPVAPDSLNYIHALTTPRPAHYSHRTHGDSVRVLLRLISPINQTIQSFSVPVFVRSVSVVYTVQHAKHAGRSNQQLSFWCSSDRPPLLSLTYTASTMYVIKRDGRQVPVRFDKITARINKLSYGLNTNYCDPVSNISQHGGDRRHGRKCSNNAPTCIQICRCWWHRRWPRASTGALPLLNWMSWPLRLRLLSPPPIRTMPS